MSAKIDCENTDRAELVEKYLLGGMGRKAQKEMESHLKECPDCSAVLKEQQKILSRLTKAARKAGWKQEQIDEISNFHKRRSLFKNMNWKLVLIIAGVLFAFTAGPLIWKSQDPQFQLQQLAELELERRLDPGVTDSSGALQNALNFHQTERHNDALLVLNKTSASLEKLEYIVFAERLIGLTYLHLQKTDSAMTHLHSALKSPSPALRQRAFWFIAQGHLLAGNRQGAESALRSAEQLPGEFKTLAQELLLRLNEL